jgi:hypothetical protein
MGSRAVIVSSIVAIAAFSSLAAGCGGGRSPGAARVASSAAATTTAPPTGPVAFSVCMRSHGVTGFPDPDGSGEFNGDTLKNVRVDGSLLRAAQARCDHLLPNGVVPLATPWTITPADQHDYLKGAACMRRHGFPDFPDPTFEGNNVTPNIPSNIDANSPQFKSAAATCQKLIPAGLPYSGSG